MSDNLGPIITQGITAPVSSNRAPHYKRHHVLIVKGHGPTRTKQGNETVMVAVPPQKHRQVENGTLVSHRNPGGKPRLYTFCGGPSWQLPFLALLALLIMTLMLNIKTVKRFIFSLIQLIQRILSTLLINAPLKVLICVFTYGSLLLLY
jgi:hypothetical protein